MAARSSHILILNWVFDEFFFRTPIAEAIRRTGLTGMARQAPVIHRTGAPSTDVAQMVVETTLAPALDTAGLRAEPCPARGAGPSPDPAGTGGARETSRCGQVKDEANPGLQLRLDRAALAGAPDVVKTAGWFGSGMAAFRRVLVWQRYREIVASLKCRGISFEPVELVTGDGGECGD